MCVLLLIITLIVLILMCLKIYMKLMCGSVKCSRHLVGKCVIVTGGTSGIGFETAKDLAYRGAKVIITSRNENRGSKAVDEIIAYTGNPDVHYENLDLASLTSVRNFANKILEKEKRLDVLINNAGIIEGGNTKTEDGLQLSMQVNHFGPFLLTNLLLPLLKLSAPSRIVNVASIAHKIGKIDFQNLNCEKEKSPSLVKTYCTSKLCNILMTIELKRRLEGTGVTTYALHPGSVDTNIYRNLDSILSKMLVVVLRLFSITSWEGAQTSIYLTVSPEVSDKSGLYFENCRVQNTSKTAQDMAVAKQLWEVSERLVKLN